MDIKIFRKQYPMYNDMTDQEVAKRAYAKYYANYLSQEEFMDRFLHPQQTPKPRGGRPADIVLVNVIVVQAINLQNERADFWKLANSLDEREKGLKARRASLEQQRRDNIAYLETLAALVDMQQAQEQTQMLNMLLLMTPTPAARAPLPPTLSPPIIRPTFPTPPQRGVITGPGGTYYYREY
jgi:hypothetical protein